MNIQEAEVIGGVDNIEGDLGLTSFFAGIYRWMAIGVFTSAVFSALTLYTNIFNFIFSSHIFYYGLIGLQLVLMIGIQMMIKKVSPEVAMGLFLLYSATIGVTMSVIFHVYSIGTIIPIFAGAVALYIALAVMGYKTKMDLSSWGSILAPMTFAIIFMSLLNMFVFQSDMFHTVISVAVLLVFGALTIYDNQAYKAIYGQIKDSEEESSRYTILGALHMYINFIAIFQSLLSLLGGSDD